MYNVTSQTRFGEYFCVIEELVAKCAPMDKKYFERENRAQEITCT